MWRPSQPWRGRLPVSDGKKHPAVSCSRWRRREWASSCRPCRHGSRAATPSGRWPPSRRRWSFLPSPRPFHRAWPPTPPRPASLGASGRAGHHGSVRRAPRAGADGQRGRCTGRRREKRPLRACRTPHMRRREPGCPGTMGDRKKETAATAARGQSGGTSARLTRLMAAKMGPTARATTPVPSSRRAGMEKAPPQMSSRQTGRPRE
mmetsp:Transcript_37311/g.105269  ORF Transcript_37311/g.105269 Transcript_37311/m.105269 type:complete len:206 (-) Transcript_37311:2417-3034(-)